MSTTAPTLSRPVQVRRSPDPAHDQSIDLADVVDAAEAPTSLSDISCWRLLTARVPLTLLVDLALPEEQFAALHEEMLAEPSSADWVPQQRRWTAGARISR